jgi:hypothetical protein
MKKILLNTLTIATLFFASAANAQVGVGVAAGDIHPSAEMEVKSSTKGFLPPRMTKAERYAILTPAAGLLIYQIDGDVSNPAGLYYFDGVLWKNGIGAQGIEGPAGATGPQGEVGPAGPKGEPGKDGVAGTSGQSVLFNPTTPPTNGMVVYKYFQNNTTTTLYDDGQIRLRLDLSTNKLYLTNVNKNFANIWSNIGTLGSSVGTSMSMNVGNGYFQNFGTSAVAMGTEMNVYSNLTTSNNYVMTMYISAPDNPSYGLYVINIYFNGPTSSLKYSNMTVNYYKDPTATP